MKTPAQDTGTGRSPVQMSTGELRAQDDAISVLLGLGVRETFADVLLAHQQDIRTVLYRRNEQAREPRQLDDKYIGAAIRRLEIIAGCRPRENVAVAVIGYIDALAKTRADRNALRAQMAARARQQAQARPALKAQPGGPGEEP